MSSEQWFGLVTGILFGFLLQKGRVLRFEKQVGAMLLEDMTILKFMLSAILVGMVGITLLTETGTIALSHKSMNLGAVLLGGALFGGGWALMGFCPARRSVPSEKDAGLVFPVREKRPVTSKMRLIEKRPQGQPQRWKSNGAGGFIQAAIQVGKGVHGSVSLPSSFSPRNTVGSTSV